jgi:hypothetical protein
MAGHNHARVTERTAIALRTVTLKHRDAMTFARAMQRGGEADGTRTDDENAFAHGSLANAPTEWVSVFEQQRGFGVDVRCAGNDGQDFAASAIMPAKFAGKLAAQNALLNPRFAFGQLAIGG